MTNSKKQSAEAAVRTMRRCTRRKLSPKEKSRIVLEGLRGELSISERCLRADMRPTVIRIVHWGKSNPSTALDDFSHCMIA